MVADFTGDPYDENQFDSENKDKFDPLESWCGKESKVFHSCDFYAGYLFSMVGLEHIETSFALGLLSTAW